MAGNGADLAENGAEAAGVHGADLAEAADVHARASQEHQEQARASSSSGVHGGATSAEDLEMERLKASGLDTFEGEGKTFGGFGEGGEKGWKGKRTREVGSRG